MWLLSACVSDPVKQFTMLVKYLYQDLFNLCTLFSKRNASLICPFFLVPLGHWPWHRVSKNLSNGLGMIPGPMAYNILQKKCTFQKLVFLLEKSVLKSGLTTLKPKQKHQKKCKKKEKEGPFREKILWRGHCTPLKFWLWFSVSQLEHPLISGQTVSTMYHLNIQQSCKFDAVTIFNRKMEWQWRGVYRVN